MPTPPDIAIEVFGKTDVGLIREHNEDNFLVADVNGAIRASDGRAPFTFKLGEKGALLLVCDGMGGAAAGEVAAQMAADAIYEALTAAEAQPRDGFARLLRRAVQRANERIFIQSRDNQSERGMGTTCTAAGLVDDTLVVAQIGDSRCYVLRDGKLAQVTKDQSLAWQLIEAGAMTAEEAKAFEHANIILQALGVQERVEVVLSQVDLRQGDVIILCSDGLHGPVGDDEMLDLLVRETDLQKAADGLIQKALDRDGPDNITVVLARFGGTALPAPAEGEVVGFLSYDPGPGPIPDSGSSSDPSSFDHAVASTSTVNERIPQELLSSDDAITQGMVERSSRGIGTAASGQGSAIRTARSVLALFFLALVAAAAGGIFVMKCERDQAAHSSEGHGGP
jgi:PPM family protein phosphatase